MDKFEIAQILREIGYAIALIDPNPKKAIAYNRASLSIESTENFEEINKTEIPGVGKALANMIETLLNNGSLPYHQELIKKVPQTLFELFNIPGFGPQKIRILYEHFKISNFEDLEKILCEEDIFTPSILQKLQRQVAHYKTEPSLLYPHALHLAKIWIDILTPFASKIEITGSLRRKCETVSEIELVVQNTESIYPFLSNYGLVQEIVFQENNKITAKLKAGILITLHLVDKKEFPATLFLTTGNSEHLKALQIQDIQSESQVYEKLHIHYIVPELREGFGEIEASKKGLFTHLIEENDLKGTFHCHTDYSDGYNTLQEMAEAAKVLGWEYIGITDHSKSSYQANGMDESRLFAQLEEIKELNKKSSTFQIFAGLECDILKDGELDFAPDILKELDFVIVSIHRYFNQDEKVMTKRLIKAIENPYTTMVGHLTGRLLRLRPPYQLNIPKVIDACIANNKIIELNSSPSRLDMDWRWWIKAHETGLKCSINPDAHTIHQLTNCHYGVNIARKGWLSKDRVINTLPLKEMRAFLKKG